MTTAPVKPPVEDEEGDEPKDQANEFQYQRQRPRSLIVVFSIVAVLALLALFGIFKALTSTAEDPNKIKFPEHVSKSLSEDQPLEDAAIPSAAKPYTTDNAVQPVLDENEPVDQLDAAQTESTLDLNPSDTQTDEVIQPTLQGDEKTDGKKPQAAPDKEPPTGPQSMIQWDRLPTEVLQPALPNKASRPQIAIVIDDMGLNRRNSRILASMKDSFTLSYLPYAGDLQNQTKDASRNGHELIVHIPMEPDNIKQNNPGPDALLTTNSPEENLRRFDKNMSGFTGYIGINNHMGSRMTADATAMKPVLQDLKRRGLWFLDSRTIGNSVAGKLAADMGVPYVVRDVFLDNTASVPAIMQQLRQTESIARKRGYAVAIGHPHDATIAALKYWLPQAKAKGYELVSLSTIIASRYPSADVPQYAVLRKGANAASLNDIEPVAGTSAQISSKTPAMTIAPFGVRSSREGPCVKTY